MKKQEKLSFIESFLLTRTQGALRSEIARAMGVHRSTVSRCIDDLSTFVPLAEDEKKRIFINRCEYLNNIKLTLHEVFALYLSARFLTLSFWPYSPHIFSCLNKLAQAVSRVSPIMGRFIQTSADYTLTKHTDTWEKRIAVLEILTRAWAENRKVTISYRSKKAAEIHSYTISIYFMEPYPAGRSLYVFGLAEGEKILRTFLVKRISQAVISEQKYFIPESFDFRRHISHAWGIWDTGQANKQVVIRFSPQVAERVRETLWHPQQKIVRQPEGSVLFQVDITEPLEMLPWIRGWGADAEVLEPKELREMMRGEAERLGKIYG